MTWWKNALATLFDIPGVVKQPDGTYVVYEGKTEDQWLQVYCMTCYAQPGEPCTAPSVADANLPHATRQRARPDGSGWTAQRWWACWTAWRAGIW